MISLATKDLNVFHGCRIRCEEERDGTRRPIAKRLCESKNRDRTVEPASIHRDVVFDHWWKSNPPSAERPAPCPQNSFNKMMFTTNPWTPWLTTGTPTSARSSEFFQGPFKDASRPAPEK